MARFKVGAQFHPQQCSMENLRAAWREADAMGIDTIWNWDHFYPLYGEADGPHFEGWTQMAAMACDTKRAMFGALVTCNSYRNPNLLADMARTVDHISGGRLILGIGAGWFQRDYDEYGYEFGTAGDRLRALEASLLRIRARLDKLNPAPIGALPIMIGGGGEKVTLRLVATYADMWNGFGPPESWAKKNAVLDGWCAKVGRDPKAVEHTVNLGPGEIDRVDAFLEAGAEHLIVGLGYPFDLAAVQRLLDARG
jgi:probable F420-dependent oxidoreductase, MSMEG_2906 family